MDEHIHNPSDGRGFGRRVFINGNEIRHVVFADTKNGIVRFAPEPARVNRRTQEIYIRTLRGEVRVESAE